PARRGASAGVPGYSRTLTVALRRDRFATFLGGFRDETMSGHRNKNLYTRTPCLVSCATMSTPHTRGTTMRSMVAAALAIASFVPLAASAQEPPPPPPPPPAAPTPPAPPPAPVAAPAPAGGPTLNWEAQVDAYYQYNFTGKPNNQPPAPIRAFDTTSNSF